MHFASDNQAGCLPEVATALTSAMAGTSGGYGQDGWSLRVQHRLSEIFERDVAVFYASTGTAANAMALASLVSEGGIILAHENAHVITSEGGAIEFFSRARLRGIPSDAGRPNDGKLSAAGVAAVLPEIASHGIHYGRASVVTVTQASEQGTVYTAEELRAIGSVAKANGLRLHMDGARFANALVATGATPAELAWKAGVDILSFGATKNGAMLAEAVILFDTSLAGSFSYLHKRSGQLFSKSRVIGAQFEAYLEEDRWLAAARHANAMAARLAAGLQSIGGVRLGWAVEANELFVAIPQAMAAALRAAGAVFYDWPGSALPASVRPGEGETAIRLVTSFATTVDGVDRFLAAAKQAG